MLRSIVILCLGLLLSFGAHANPKFDYLLHCGGCHLPDGSGSPPQVPSLREKLGPIVSIPEGRSYIARVPGASQAPISDAALAEVLNWVLREFNDATLPDGFKSLTSKEVQRARSRVLADPLKYRAQFWPSEAY